MNLRGREVERREERLRDIVRFVEVRLDIRAKGREREVRIADVVLSIEVRAARY